jgi:hypothetical protein
MYAKRELEQLGAPKEFGKICKLLENLDINMALSVIATLLDGTIVNYPDVAVPFFDTLFQHLQTKGVALPYKKITN